jgi:hypothetical protein
MAYPGQQANGFVRVLGILTIVAAILIGLVMIAFGADPSDPNGWGFAIGVAIALNGMLGGALLVVFGALGDNIIAIRTVAERAGAARAHPGAGPYKPADGAPKAKPGEPACSSCGTALEPDANFCTGCGNRLLSK